MDSRSRMRVVSPSLQVFSTRKWVFRTRKRVSLRVGHSGIACLQTADQGQPQKGRQVSLGLAFANGRYLTLQSHAGITKTSLVPRPKPPLPRRRTVRPEAGKLLLGESSLRVRERASSDDADSFRDDGDLSPSETEAAVEPPDSGKPQTWRWVSLAFLFQNGCL